MSALITWLRKLIRWYFSLEHLLNKVALIGLDGVGKVTLLQHLSDTPLGWRTPDPPFRGLQGRSGRNQQLGFDLTSVDLGGGAPTLWHEATASLFADSRALIVVVNFLDPVRLDELRYFLALSVDGQDERGRYNDYPKLTEGIPWLVLINFFEEPVDKEKAEKLNLDDLRVDWTFRSISTVSGQGVNEAIAWLRTKLDGNVVAPEKQG
ncbi:hypothetical protein BO71DRAFT_442886 [Aspergillus ellipticus CBS 707.79]|uniref:P-loop containing nucleoside triphosphate hydrolase protein n=1 Tax=Aspergillus ellipticus CBS 707.79 TaxID=1448320 RepID=A0A319D355_9EURO|nr:hypothetical protein BO71DRAFT_442886 [Aspergillus ellipticus CBS 707.79]